MVYAMVRNWVGMVAKNKAAPDGLGFVVAEKAELFYAGKCMIFSTNPVWLHWLFNVLIGLFVRVGLRKNVVAMVAMV